MSTTRNERSREAAAFLDSCQYTAPGTVSACEGWTAHGRRPDERGRVRSHLTEPALSRLHALLAGY
ncbi:MAG TPA: hypothetical protein VGI84_01295 [Pseudonocardiaceae bacterium]